MKSMIRLVAITALCAGLVHVATPGAEDPVVRIYLPGSSSATPVPVTPVVPIIESESFNGLEAENIKPRNRKTASIAVYKIDSTNNDKLTITSGEVIFNNQPQLKNKYSSISIKKDTNFAKKLKIPKDEETPFWVHVKNEKNEEKKTVRLNTSSLNETNNVLLIDQELNAYFGPKPVVATKAKAIASDFGAEARSVQGETGKSESSFSRAKAAAATKARAAKAAAATKARAAKDAVVRKARKAKAVLTPKKKIAPGQAET